MYALYGALGLVVFTYIRPQEFVPQLAGIPWINLWLVMMVGGFLADIGRGTNRKEATPPLRLVGVFYVWCFTTMGIKNPGELSGNFTYITTGFTLSLILQHGIQNVQGFMRLVRTVFVTTMFCVCCAFHQGLQPFSCMIVTPTDDISAPILTPDGRFCEKRGDCEEGPGSDEDVDYWCERIGVLGTTSISQGRVRWRGVLQDPNETTLAAGSVIPYAFAFFETNRTFWRLLLVLGTVVIVAITDIFSQSRGAILIFMTVLGIYFVRKYGVRGAIVGGAMGSPLLMLGGRSGEEAAKSAEERLEVMADGLNMFFGNPVIGVGYNQFTKHSFLTAHNAYVLAAAELGLFGFTVWLIIVYLHMKTFVVAYQRYAKVPGADFIRAWSLALFASFAGTLVGIFFLSWTYHYVLWIYFGIAGAFYSAIRDTDPFFEVKTTMKEKGIIGCVAVGFMVVLRVYAKYKGH